MEKNYLIFDIGVDAKNKMEGLNPLYKRISFSGVKSKEFEKVMTHSSERKLLTDFWELTESKAYILAGFNVIRFDIPYLYIRSLINNVKVPNLKDRILDLRLILSNGNPNFKGKLDEYGALMGFGLCTSGFSKSNFRLLWQGYEIPELKERLLFDVRMTYALFQRMKSVGLI